MDPFQEPNHYFFRTGMSLANQVQGAPSDFHKLDYALQGNLLLCARASSSSTFRYFLICFLMKNIPYFEIVQGVTKKLFDV